ncbi:MAG: DUF2905 family protein [Gemmatimonadetes bacterium]|nr:DUF2905 domain-containing protein [Gemmatimonadota bacterium]NIR77023.1 DUF2905 domain-containing protein [Gemmatimonadota bacterium]NIT85552.1 DUF2905 domain-containing protein [Gemmatimonadota bacterium]NIU29382.1 DUF2905 domain-containing protein [Gemmatimonadota bacterium]NIU34438.1 DUF2905 family protein [Gemmatimonadota bacterium]
MGQECPGPADPGNRRSRPPGAVRTLPPGPRGPRPPPSPPRGDTDRALRCTPEPVSLRLSRGPAGDDRAGKVARGSGDRAGCRGRAHLWALGRTGFRGLPGDIRYETENVRVYFPIVTMLVLSVLLSALLWLVQWLGRR